MIPGEVIIKNNEIEINAGLATKKVKVANNGDRPSQIGSHYHFFEVNKILKFDRAAAYGYRLNIPSGTSVRFEPGETKEVELVELGGNKRVFGANNLTNNQINATTAEKALLRAKLKGFN